MYAPEGRTVRAFPDESQGETMSGHTAYEPSTTMLRSTMKAIDRLTARTKRPQTGA